MNAEKICRDNAGGSIYEMLEEETLCADIPNDEKSKFLQKLSILRANKTNIMVVGSTGAGKSSTINALFNVERAYKKANDYSQTGNGNNQFEDVATIGVEATPQTEEVQKYELGNLILWDTPGLGDGQEADKRHVQNIVAKLAEMDDEGHPLIDLVLVIVDASTKDLGTSYQLINDVIIPALNGDGARILVAVNQADIAMRGGSHWDYTKNEPDQVLCNFLEKKMEAIRVRIKSETGVAVCPIYYSAGFKEEGQPQQRPYNLSKLLYYIIKQVPAEKRLAFVDNLNDESNAWQDDDGVADYSHDTFRSIGEAISDTSEEGATIGKEVLGWPGWLVGKIVGGFCGFFLGVADKIFG